MEPCTTPCTPVTEEQLTSVECDDVRNGVIVELKKQGSSNDADNDSLSDIGLGNSPPFRKFAPL